MNSWFQRTDNEDEIVIEFVPGPSRFWSPEILRQLPLSEEGIEGKRVTLTGSGAVWMYAHAAAFCQKARAHAIAVSSPRTAGTNDDLSTSQSRLVMSSSDGSVGAILQIQFGAGPPLSPGAIEQLILPRIDELNRLKPQSLVIRGRASVATYAEIAKAAMAAGVKTLFCWSARDGLIVVHDQVAERIGASVPLPDWLADTLSRTGHCVVIGVIGDPNRGKSVISGVMDWYRDCIQRAEGWKLDCDGQAPTPTWYLSLIGKLSPEAISRHRAADKRPWSDEMQQEIADQLKRGREFFSVIVADLPGGNVKADQRIPPGREAMMEQVDAFVLIDREDDSTEAKWREALRAHGLEHRISVVLQSRSPHAEPRLVLREREGEVWRGEAYGLDRSRQPQELGRAYQEQLDQLWSFLLQRGSARPR